MRKKTETVEAVATEPARKRYQVTASKSTYFHEDYGTAEEALEVATRLVHESYTTVSVRDHENNDSTGDIW